MDENIMQEIFHEFISTLEKLDTQSSALAQFLKDKGVVNPQELAPYLERASNASGVRWLGVRVRMDYLFSSAAKSEELAAEKSHSAERPHSEDRHQEPKPTGPGGENTKAADASSAIPESGDKSDGKKKEGQHDDKKRAAEHEPLEGKSQ